LVTTCMLVETRISVGFMKSRLPAGCASQASASPGRRRTDAAIGRLRRAGPGRRLQSHERRPGGRKSDCMLVETRISVGFMKSRLPAGCASQASASPIATCVSPGHQPGRRRTDAAIGRLRRAGPGRRLQSHERRPLVETRISVGFMKSRLPAGCASQASASPIATCVISSWFEPLLSIPPSRSSPWTGWGKRGDLRRHLHLSGGLSPVIADLDRFEHR
jgi:hypothetical protein